MPVRIRPAEAGECAELATVAAQTFPLACPPSTSGEDIAAFVAANLSDQCFADHLADPDRLVVTAVTGGRIVGYALVVHTTEEAELSKIYVLPDHHSTGAAAKLMRAAIDWAARRGARAVRLGVNQKNQRAQRFYRKHGFEIVGTRSFRLGNSTQDDFVMARPL